MQRRGFIKTIGLVAVILVVIGVILYAVVQPSVGWPSEDRRVVHPGGFSVVQPIGWEKHVVYGDDSNLADSIRFLPIKSVGAPGFFTVVRLRKPPTDAELSKQKYQPTTFVGHPAYERIRTFTDTREQMRSVVFDRDGTWFDITIRRPDSEPITSGVWLAYAESFKTEPVQTRPTVLIGEGLPLPGVGPTSTPATVPATQAGH